MPRLDVAVHTLEAHPVVVLHTLEMDLLEVGSVEDKHMVAAAEHLQVIVAALSLSHPDHTANHNMLVALIALCQAGALVVLRLPHSSLICNTQYRKQLSPTTSYTLSPVQGSFLKSLRSTDCLLFRLRTGNDNPYRVDYQECKHPVTILSILRSKSFECYFASYNYTLR